MGFVYYVGWTRLKTDMAYIRTKPFDLGIVDVENEQILQNELSLGRWVVDAITLLLSQGESFNLQHRIEIKRFGFFYIPDVYLEKGCEALGWNGKTMIDFKSNLLIDSELKQSKFYNNLIEDGCIDNIIVVFINYNVKEVKDLQFFPNVKFIAAEQIINQAKAAIREGWGEINKALQSGGKRERQWMDIREDRLVNAINDTLRYDCVMFLGAGVSASAQRPDWETLLKNLLSQSSVINSNDYDEVYKEMDYSNLLTARYIQNVLKVTNRELVNQIRGLLYSQQNNAIQSDLISSICNVIKTQKNVKSVITYNYDTFIEDNLKEIGVRSFAVCGNNRDDNNSFPVYHVHGVIFQEYSNDSNEEIVLTENDYHRVYSEVFDWSNVEQLHALTRCTCLFIGLSMKDPNLRRFLEIANKDRGTSVRHYVFLERKSFSDDTEKEETDFQTREDMFADLGVNVIWYKGNDNHKELPLLLQRFAK